VRLLRGAALIAMPLGAAGAVALFLRQAQRTPALVIAGFIVWMLSPFVIVGWAYLISARWATATRTALDAVALVVSIGSLAAYGQVIDITPRGAANAFRFVAVAPASWLLIAVALSFAAFMSRGAEK